MCFACIRLLPNNVQSFKTVSFLKIPKECMAKINQDHELTHNSDENSNGYDNNGSSYNGNTRNGGDGGSSVAT